MGDENMKLGNNSIAGLALLALTNFAGAHLGATSLSPKATDMLTVGQAVNISWTVTTAHPGGTDIAFSKDGGTTWTTIKQGFEDKMGSNTFNWTGPDAMTNTGKIRICQRGSSTGRTCTDADNISAPGGSAPYVLVSGAFMVMASTGIIDPNSESNSLALNFRSDSRNVEVSFINSQSQPFLLQAFDTQGRLVANLIDGNYAAGSHQLSVFSNRLEMNAKALVFKLKVGNQVKTQTWNGI
jgi:hypothetical protein